MIPKLFAKKNLFWKLVFPWADLALLQPMKNILWDDVVFKLRKTRQKLALSLTPLGAVRAAAEGTGYKNRRLGKSRGSVEYSSTRDWSNLYGAIRPQPETAAQYSLPARTSECLWEHSPALSLFCMHRCGCSYCDASGKFCLTSLRVLSSSA